MTRWRWQRLDERWDDERVEQQLHELGCGAACVVMLLADRQIAADQLVVTAGLHLPSTAQELASRLNEFSVERHRWVGGHLDTHHFEKNSSTRCPPEARGLSCSCPTGYARDTGSSSTA